MDLKTLLFINLNKILSKNLCDMVNAYCKKSKFLNNNHHNDTTVNNEESPKIITYYEQPKNSNKPFYIPFYHFINYLPSYIFHNQVASYTRRSDDLYGSNAYFN